MANTSSSWSQSVPRAGLRATLRFRWKSQSEPNVSREVFGRSVIIGLFKLSVRDVYCLQTNSREASFDVTFDTHAVCERVLEESRRLAGTKPLSAFEVISLDRPNFRVVTVHVYNPYVPDEAVGAFLGRYSELLTAPRRVNDALGFWTGKRQYQVLLKEDPGGFDGFAHPPASFTIGADRGYLFYSRQPPFCRKCRGHGHMDGACEVRRCRFCSAVGHEAKDCPVPKSCSICQSLGHLARSCPKKAASYAGVVSRRGGEAERRSGDPGEVVKDGGEVVLRPLEEVVAELELELEAQAAVEGAQGPSAAAAVVAEQAAGGEPPTSTSAPVPPDVVMSGMEEEGIAEVPHAAVASGEGAEGKKKKKKRGNRAAVEAQEGTSKKVKGSPVDGAVVGGCARLMDAPGNTGGEGSACIQHAEVATEEQGEDPVGVFSVDEPGSLGSVDLTAGEGPVFGGLSPLGQDGYGGPLLPSLIPNEVPFSWAEETGDNQDLYG